MANPLSILNALAAARVEPSATEQTKLTKALEKALQELLPKVSLASARRVDRAMLSEIEDFLAVQAGRKPLTAIAKAWDPKAAPLADLTDAEVARLLIELVSGKREPYAPTQHSLPAARALPPGERAALSRSLSMLAPTKDLGALLKRWDKHWSTTGLDRAALLSRLHALLDGTEEPKPAQPKSISTRRREGAG